MTEERSICTRERMEPAEEGPKGARIWDLVERHEVRK